MAPPTSERSALSRLGLAVLVSGLAGLLVAGLALPVVGTLGLAAKAGADDFLALPTELQTPPLATRSRVLASDGSLLATFYDVDRITTEPSDVPDVVKQAVVAIEDSRFYDHEGVDVRGTIRAAVTNAQSGRVAQGGSTLTQQYVKNALIEAAAGDQEAERAAREESADRKLREARYALALEEQIGKDEILHRYLEVAYFGNAVYGIGAAADFYFNKSVRDLTLTESAELAGLVQNPNRFNPMSTDGDVRRDVLARRNTVLTRMLDLAMIDRATWATATEAALPRVAPRKVARNCDAPDVTGPFFCDHVLRELTTTDVGAALGSTPEERRATVLRGGLTIATTLDPAIQQAAQTAVDERLPRDDPSGAAAVSDVVEPGTGHIKAMAVDRTFGTEPGETEVNFANGAYLGFQPGSTFKMFTLAAALAKGIPTDTRINSPAEYTSDVFLNKGVPYEVSNAGDSQAGRFDLRTGTAGSVNTFYIQLAERVGLEPIYSLAEAMGVRQRTGFTSEEPLDRNSAAGVIGAFTVSPLAMAGAYASLPAHGLYCPPRAVLSITGRSGPIAVPENACSQVLEPAVADTVADILRGAIEGGTASRNGQIGRPAAGKTGTTNDSTAAWFVGFTPQLATAVWVGRPEAVTGHVLPMRRVRIGGQYYAQMYGGDLPTQIWQQTMSEALRDLPEEPLSPPDPEVEDGREIIVPDTTGVSSEEAFRRLTEAGLAPTRGRRVSSSLPEGVTAYTFPAAGEETELGDTVYVYTSTGQVFTPPPTPPAPTAPPPAAPAVPTVLEQFRD